jgi:hypothetical protein
LPAATITEAAKARIRIRIQAPPVMGGLEPPVHDRQVGLGEPGRERRAQSRPAARGGRLLSSEGNRHGPARELDRRAGLAGGGVDRVSDFEASFRT